MIKKVKRILAKNEIEFVQLILFGSRACGYEKDHSDIDLCLILPNSQEKKIEAIASSLHIQIGLAGIDSDFLVYSEKEFRRKSISPIRHQIKTTGIDVTDF